MLPDNVQELCRQYLESVNSRTSHNLDVFERFILYHSFGPSRLDQPGYLKGGDLFNAQEYSLLMQKEILNFVFADYTMGWLAILTAKHVLPVWNQVDNLLSKDVQRVSAQEVLDVAEKLLQHKITFDVASTKLDRFEGEGELLSEKVTYNIDCALESAQDALSFILVGFSRRAYRSIEGEGWDLFVTNALEAYSAIDRNPPKILDEAVTEFSVEDFLKIQKSSSLPERYQISTPRVDIEYDLQKRREFWEWWLTEAIPQAWELAEKSVSAQ